jgi:hypothetical protein
MVLDLADDEIELLLAGHFVLHVTRSAAKPEPRSDPALVRKLRRGLECDILPAFGNRYRAST